MRIFLLLLSTATLFGQNLSFHFDPAKTRVDFTLADVLHTVHGTFRLKGGDIQVDLATGASSGALVVDAASGASGNSSRDSRMHSNILESGKFSEITFVPDRVIGSVNPRGSSDIQLHGIFTIHGSAHEMTVPVHAEVVEDQVNASVRFPVPYVKWGMKNPSTLFLRVSDTVQIDIHAAGHLLPPD